MRPLAPFFFIAILSAGCASKPKAKAGTPPFLTNAYASVPGRVDVRVSGIPSVEGQLFVELYDRPRYFHYEWVLLEKIVPVTGGAMTVTLEHVPKGRYIVAASHDANSNHELDTGLFGIPQEAYGFSRDARGTFGPPDFEDGAFDFDGATVAMNVAVR